MSRRMRRPDTVKLDISQGDWLLVKRHLTAGEQRAMFAGMMREDGEGIDRVKVGFSKILTYLLDWSFEDFDGKPLVIAGQPENVVSAALNGIDGDAFSDVLAAIEAHMDAMEKARELEKNAAATVSASLAT